MKRMMLTVAMMAWGLASAVGAEADRQAAEEAAIRKAVESYVAAFNQGDAKALAAMWSPEAVYTNPLSGEQVVGRAEIEKQFAAIFADAKGAKLEAKTDSIQFVSPSVGIEQGTAKVIVPDQAPEVAPDKAEWMPLGVFALTPDGQASGPDPTLFLQLAISKEGIINGTLHNTATNQTQTIEGMADKASQRAAWTVAGKTRPIMETGIVNLTQDTSPALVHFADGQTQQWLMVRLEEPAAGQ